jgi:hypothetical protein
MSRSLAGPDLLLNEAGKDRKNNNNNIRIGGYRRSARDICFKGVWAEEQMREDHGTRPCHENYQGVASKFWVDSHVPAVTAWYVQLDPQYHSHMVSAPFHRGFHSIMVRN